MLSNEDAMATVATKNLEQANDFYEKKVGLKKLESPEKEVLLFKSGTSQLIVYKSQFAGTNQASAVTWAVDDVDATVRDLKSRGVTFEHYQFPNMKLEGDVHVMGRNRAAWFKDPDGNILAIANK
jgi:catechol 2,3-dioxygenase-like lactoylglutathione lyase family enzyme